MTNFRSLSNLKALFGDLYFEIIEIIAGKVENVSRMGCFR